MHLSGYLHPPGVFTPGTNQALLCWYNGSVDRVAKRNIRTLSESESLTSNT